MTALLASLLKTHAEAVRAANVLDTTLWRLHEAKRTDIDAANVSHDTEIVKDRVLNKIERIRRVARLRYGISL